MSTIDTKHVLRSLFAVILVAGVHTAVGCASDEPKTNFGDYDASAGGVTYGTGGTTSTGGTTMRTGGTTSTGGTTTATGGAAGSTSEAGACVPPNPLLSTASFKPCNIGPDCTDGVCVQISLMTAVGVTQASLDLLADCAVPDGGSAEKCVPKMFVEYANKFVPKTCTSVAGAEGRCMSTCIPLVDQQKSFLPQDVCNTGELCAPCYDPRTGLATGACSQGCDTGPTQPPVTFASCCSGNGQCVPTSLVPSQDVSLLGTDTCTGTDVLCAPTKFEDPTYKPPSCNSVCGVEGRCIPSCVPAVQARAANLPQDSCATGELCAPCYDPINGTATGACTVNGDTPTSDAPVTCPTCCGGVGHCITTADLTTQQQSLLGQDTCSSGSLCAPDIFADPTQTAQTCVALTKVLPNGAEGRCIPNCVPEVDPTVNPIAQYLDQSTCPTGYTCAPCYNPIDGTSTGACSQNGDSPKQAAVTFASCGSGQGLCVPRYLVPTNLQPALPVDTCPTTLNDAGVSEYLCAPTEKVKDINYKFPACTGGLGAGACVPKYLALYAGGDPTSQLAATFFATCSSLGVTGLPAGNDWLCAPCTNPLNGQPTGACL